MRMAKETDLTSAIAVVDWSRMPCAFCASTPEQPVTTPAAETTSASASKRRICLLNRLWEPRDGYPKGVTQAALRSAYTALSRGSAS
jgi:hypothetical protein